MKRNNLAKLRIDLGYNSTEMADKLGISLSYYSNIENGKKDPSFEFIERLERLCIEKSVVVDDVWELFKKFK